MSFEFPSQNEKVFESFFKKVYYYRDSREMAAVLPVSQNFFIKNSENVFSSGFLGFFDQ